MVDYFGFVLGYMLQHCCITLLICQNGLGAFCSELLQ